MPLVEGFGGSYFSNLWQRLQSAWRGLIVVKNPPNQDKLKGTAFYILNQKIAATKEEFESYNITLCTHSQNLQDSSCHC